nr:hypothetical protein [Demequina sp.]
MFPIKLKFLSVGESKFACLIANSQVALTIRSFMHDFTRLNGDHDHVVGLTCASPTFEKFDLQGNRGTDEIDGRLPDRINALGLGIDALNPAL